MRPVRHRRFATNGTPNSLQTAVIKDFSPGLQIRPRRFDSGLGLHPENPADHGLRVFYWLRFDDHFRNFWDRFRKQPLYSVSWSLVTEGWGVPFVL